MSTPEDGRSPAAPSKSQGARARSAASKRTPVKRAGVDGGREAAERAVDRDGLKVSLPGAGRVSLPPADHLVWYGGVAALAALEIIEWPIALVVAVGKVLADNRSHRTLRSLGEALEESA